MKSEILFGPSFSLLKIDLSAGEKITAEAGAMVSFSPSVSIKTEAKGGIMGALKRKALGGESFFINTFSAEDDGEITLAPPLPGDIIEIELNDETMFAQAGAFLAATENVELDVKFGGAKTFFSKEGLFLLKISGTGKVYLSSYGAIRDINLAAGEKYIVDTGHVVSFSASVAYEVKKVGGLKSTLFSGEGLVCELTGPGKITVQSRSESAFLSWLIPKLPIKS